MGMYWKTIFRIVVILASIIWRIKIRSKEKGIIIILIFYNFYLLWFKIDINWETKS